MRRTLLLLAFASLPRLSNAQGVTTAAIQGTVTGEDGTPIAGASVRVTNLSDGRRWEVTTRSSGGYLLEDVAVGGPYRIEARALGFAPQARAGIVLALNQRLVAEFTLLTAAVELAPVAVDASADPQFNPSRTGPAEVISAARIAALPNLGRDFFTLTALSPQVAVSPSSARAPTGGIAIGGQNRLLNEFQIDGGVNHDLYTGRLPGRGTLPRPIAIEALEEIQVLVAPFDVRQGGFAGGLANAVTKSGTNIVHGSTFAYLADGALVGKDATGDPVAGFTTWQYGGTIAGPIVHDRAHYFLSVDAQHRVVPDPGPLIADTAGGADLANIGIRYPSATRFQDILRNTYGLDPGTLSSSNGRVPATDVFGKITVQLATNSQLELSHHYSDGDRSGFIDRAYRFYWLSSTGKRDVATANASRLIWTSLLAGRWSSELIASHLRLRDACRPNVSYPQINVNADQGVLMAGTGMTCPTSFVQDAFEVQENLSAAFGVHVLTLGTHVEMLRFEDGQLLGGAGLWRFRHLDSLEAGRAFHYERTLAGPSRTGVVVFHARQLGLYVQDRWQPARGLTLTAGLRMELPVLPDGSATYVPLKDSLGADTGRLPGGKPLWSPRLALNYDLRGAGRTFLRGGIGLFSGRPPYTWLGSAYRDEGTQQLFLLCVGAAAPAFDPVNQPTVCANGAAATPQLSYFDPNVSFPQSLKMSLGLDHRLPGDVVVTVDLLYTRAAHQWYYGAANLPAPVGVAQGEGNRPLYGTIGAATGVATPGWLTPALGQVVRVSDRSGDRSLTLSVQMRKWLGDRVELNALYAHTRAQDRMSLANFQARPNLQNTPLDGTLEGRRLRTSYFEIPHRLELSAAVRLPHQVRLSLLYAGSSGMPFTYTVTGDANADGIGTAQPFFNDIVYVPRDRTDIELDGNGTAPGLGTAAQQDSVYALLDGFIRAEPCLREQRGGILERNSCHNPSFGMLNARVTKAFPTLSSHYLELTADVYNVLNLLNRRWGQSRFTAGNPPTLSILQLAGYDAGAGRGVYQVPLLPRLRQAADLASRWQMELSVRYVF